jgi:hypothetical protein
MTARLRSRLGQQVRSRCHSEEGGICEDAEEGKLEGGRHRHVRLLDNPHKSLNAEGRQKSLLL